MPATIYPVTQTFIGIGDNQMIRKLLAVCALAFALGAAATFVSSSPAEAKCKFGCGLAIGLGAGIVGSAIIDSNRRDYRSDGYDRPQRHRRFTCRDARRECRADWGHGSRRYYRCVDDYGC